jgi:hypothetical protein
MLSLCSFRLQKNYLPPVCLSVCLLICLSIFGLLVSFLLKGD